MIEIFLSGTEAEIVLRAFKLARESGKFPDPSIKGDQTRVDVLQQELEKKLKLHQATTWGGSKRKRKPGVIS